MTAAETPETSLRSNLAADVLAGVSVAAVLIPQSVAYAALAGLPAHRGLFAGALPPIAAALFASSPYLQTGPVALTALLTFGALSTVSTPGTDEYVMLAALLAVIVGVTRAALGLLKAGALSYLMSRPVQRGFTSAAAVLIAASQLPAVLGVGPDGEGIIVRAFRALAAPGAWDFEALGLATATIAIIVGLKRRFPLFPGVLLAVVAGILYSWLRDYDGAIVGAVRSGVFPEFVIDLPWARIPMIVVSGVIIALVGFADVVAVAQTYAEQTRRPWDPNREFLSQGAANIAAGLAGSFPVGASFSRSALNRSAGARTRWSGAITGVTVLLFIPFAGVLTPLPQAVLGAVIIATIGGLMRLRPLLALWNQARLQATVGLSVFALTLALSPRVDYAVLGGVALSLALHVWREQHVEVVAWEVDDVLVLRPMGVIWFGSAPLFRQALVAELVLHPEVDRIRVDLSHVGRIDLTGALALNDVVESAKASGVAIAFDPVPHHAQALIARVCPLVPQQPERNAANAVFVIDDTAQAGRFARPERRTLIDDTE